MEVHAHTTAERLFTVCTLLLATFTFAVFAGNVTQLILQMATLRKAQARQDGQLWRFIQERGISHELVVCIRFFLANRRRREYLYETEVEVFTLLPDRILKDLHDDVRSPTLYQGSWLFSLLQDVVPQLLCDMCHSATQEVVLLEGETIFVRGETCGRMLAVSRGLLAYRHGSQMTKVRMTPPAANGEQCKQLFRVQTMFFDDSLTTASHWDDVRPNTFLSEATLWVRWRHHGTAASKMPSLLIAVDCVRFEEVVKTNDAARFLVIGYARQFVQHLNSTATLASDLMLGPPKHRSTVTERRSSFGAFSPGGIFKRIASQALSRTQHP